MSVIRLELSSYVSCSDFNRILNLMSVLVGKVKFEVDAEDKVSHNGEQWVANTYRVNSLKTLMFFNAPFSESSNLLFFERSKLQPNTATIVGENTVLSLAVFSAVVEQVGGSIYIGNASHPVKTVANENSPIEMYFKSRLLQKINEDCHNSGFLEGHDLKEILEFLKEMGDYISSDSYQGACHFAFNNLCLSDPKINPSDLSFAIQNNPNLKLTKQEQLVLDELLPVPITNTQIKQSLK